MVQEALNPNKVGKSGENIVASLLSSQDYVFRSEKKLIDLADPYRIDHLVHLEGGSKILIEVKTLISGGSAEKIVTDTACRLSDLLENSPSHYKAAYIVLVGDAWSEKYLSRLRRLVLDPKLSIITVGDFANLVASKKLGK